jgi:hypothetical protein
MERPHYVCAPDADGLSVTARLGDGIIVAKDADRDLVNEANTDIWSQANAITLLEEPTVMALLAQQPQKFYMCPWERMRQIVDSVPLHLRSRLAYRRFSVKPHRTPCPICTAVLEAQLDIVAKGLPVVGVPEIVIAYVGQFDP